METPDKVFDSLVTRYGKSAASTYWGARHIGGYGVLQSLALCKDQAAKLGTSFPGGIECLPWRGRDGRVSKLMELGLYFSFCDQ